MKTKEILIESDLLNIKKKDINDLNEIADQIRQFLIQTVSQTGGHIGTNLGVVELTLALHYVFDINNDKLIFDTGHQGYTHKLLTGRLNDFSTLNQENGMSRFLSTKENENDLIEASHAGTAISIASGYAYDFFLNKKKNTQAVAIVGDGALVEGMSFEGLNFGTSENLPLVIIINDNGMAIPEKYWWNQIWERSGENWKEKSEGFFRGLGYQWASVADGHNISELVNVLSNVKKARISQLFVMLKQQKEKGLEISKKHPYKLHFSMPFDPESGEGTSAIPAGVSYTIKAGEAIQKSMKENEDLLVLTPSTPYASALDDVLRTYPDRCVDVGMAEQHLLGMAVGLSKQGRDVFACYQSTFLQRAFDQILHDISYMDVPITILSVRSAFGFQVR